VFLEVCLSESKSAENNTLQNFNIDRDTVENCTIERLYRQVSGRFKAAKILTAELDARLLICNACELTAEAFIACPERLVPLSQRSHVEGFVTRRLNGEPVSRILGVREFWSMPFQLSASTLDPRADTETLIEHCIELAREKGWLDEPLHILDLGTGTGCILLSLLSEFPKAVGVGTDLSYPALNMARKNAQYLGYSARTSFIAGHWLEPLSGEFDIVVSNPPYICHGDIALLSAEVAIYDPHGALDGGEDGLDAYRHIMPRLPHILKPGGFVVFEIGEGQKDSVQALIKSAKLDLFTEKFTFKKDLCGIVRSVAALWLDGYAHKTCENK
jgi:release factor glutamine methyltransferase